MICTKYDLYTGCSWKGSIAKLAFCQESQITATNPNRVTLVSGSVNVPGSPQNKSQGGVYIDNNETPGMSTRER